MANLPQRRDGAFASSRRSSLGGPGPGDGPDPQTPAEKSVQFINAEVLDPPAQGKMSFAGPYIDQTLAMALEDARSFLQGAEQILLVAMARALNNYLTTGSPVGEPKAPQITNDAQPATAEDSQAEAHEAQQVAPDTPEPAPASPAPAESEGHPGLKEIRLMLGSLAKFHSDVADTAHKHKAVQ